MTDISVITAAFNTERYLHRCIQSVLSETEADIELILIDDGSSDNTLAVMRYYQQRDPRVRVMAQENTGQGPARNRGIELAEGRFLYFLDSDDYIAKQNSMSAMLRAAERHNLDLCSPGAPRYYFDKPHELISAIPTRMQFVSRRLVGSTYRSSTNSNSMFSPRPGI